VAIDFNSTQVKTVSPHGINIKYDQWGFFLYILAICYVLILTSEFRLPHFRGSMATRGQWLPYSVMCFVIPALRMLRQDGEFKASLGYIARSCGKRKTEVLVFKPEYKSQLCLLCYLLCDSEQVTHLSEPPSLKCCGGAVICSRLQACALCGVAPSTPCRRLGSNPQLQDQPQRPGLLNNRC
jgi:hypothetical protein